MSVQKHYHIIPQIYLQAFEDTTKPKDFLENKPFTPFIWLIDKSLKVQPNRQSPKKSLRKNRFYKLDDDSDESPVIEKALSHIERKYSDVLRKICDRKSLNPQDVGDLIIFIETLHHRTESYIEHWQNQINKIEEIYREVDQVHNKNQQISDVFWEGSHEAAKKLIITGLGVMGKILLETGIVLVFNESELEFFSSDNPVTWTHTHIDDLQKWNVPTEWFHENIKNNHKKFFCFCPITPKIALIASPFFEISNKEVYQYLSNNDLGFVYSMNFLTHLNANSIIISNKSNPYAKYREQAIKQLKQIENSTKSEGVQILFYTDQARYLIEIENYEIEDINPVFWEIKFWTKDFKTLRDIVKDNLVELIQIFENGAKTVEARNLQFNTIALYEDEPSIIKQDF